MPPPYIFQLAAFLIGLLFGSFLNVCISRLPWHQSIVKPRSHCPRCHAPIHWYDNIQLVSFVLLRAKCRNCKATIPWRYPLVELSVGLWLIRPADALYGIVQYHYYWDFLKPTIGSELTQVASLATIAILGFLLIGLLVMDWQTHTLPDAFTLTGMAIGFVLTCISAAFIPTGQGDIKFDPRHSLRVSSPGSFVAKGNVFMTGTEATVLGRVGAILAAAGLILLIRLIYKKIRHREGLGLGDAKLMAMIAAFLGFAPAMLALFLGVILCAAYALTLLARRRADALTQLPLGTFLCLGGLFAALFGPQILMWYTSLL
jgi:leader peptidase (prepilin peptidase)/N-methyltransferase